MLLQPLSSTKAVATAALAAVLAALPSVVVVVVVLIAARCARAELRQLPPPIVPPGVGGSQESALLAADFFRLASAGEQLAPVWPQAQPTPPKTAASSQHKQLQLNVRSSRPLYSAALGGAAANGFRLDEYHSLRDIYSYLDALAASHSNVRVFTIGKTAELRPIRALEIIQNATDPDYVWLDSLTHAREWITGSTLLYIVDSLVAGKWSTPASGGAARVKNYIVVPVVNPDGYSYTWTTNRLWRKNRAASRTRAPESKCVGADLNRNFDHTFGGDGSSPDPCSQIYSGSHPFSENETRALADLMWSLKDRIKFYLTIHSFNQLWACPYAHTLERSASYARHMRVLRAIQRAVYDAEGLTYEIGPLGESLYVGSGFGIDFAYDKCKIEHSYLVELRDKGERGFALPPDQIVPTARETFAGLQAGLNVVFGYV